MPARKAVAVVEVEGSVHHAAALGNTGQLDQLLRRGQTVHDRDADGSTPLHQAATAGKVAMVTHLLELRADINSQSAGGFTPLICAANNGHLKVVDVLLGSGADVLIECSEGLMAADYAHFRYHHAVAALLDRATVPHATAPDVWEAVARPDLVFLKHALHNRRCAPDCARGPTGETLLIAACQAAARDLRAVHFLLYFPAVDPNAADREGNTAVHLAIRRGEEGAAVLQELVACNRVRLDLPDRSGVTPFLLAVRLDHRPLLSILAQRPYDLNVNARDRNGHGVRHVVEANEAAATVL
eukprot:EG_transcript_21071